MPRILTLLFILLFAPPVVAQQILIDPYLQDVRSTSAHVVWSTEGDDDNRVEWGTDPGLGQVTAGGPGNDTDAGVVHDVRLTGLEPDTRYFYRAVTGAADSDVSTFRTAPDQPRPLRLAFLSDTEQDAANPTVFEDLVRRGIVPVAAERGAVEEVEEALDAWFIAGDLVDEHGGGEDFVGDFFPQARALSGRVPLYVVPGSEGEAADFYLENLFFGPDNGSSAADARWWYVDRPGLRVFGLDTREGGRTDEQLGWLDDRLAEVCDAGTVVLAVLHNPFQAELFTPLEVPWTGEVVSRLDAHAARCGGITGHVFGTNHGYSRGASRDARQLWIAPGSGGGALDAWGTEPQADREEIVFSDPAYGFVLLEVDPGEELRLVRYSWGDWGGALENEVVDSLVLPLNAPTPPAPGAPEELEAGLWSAAPGDETPLQSALWQAVDCVDEVAVGEVWQQTSNWYEAAEQAPSGPVTELEPPSDWEEACLRVRVRSEALVWSDWSRLSEPPGVVSGCGGCAQGSEERGLMGFALLLLGVAVWRRRG